jgi:hypothetical protein
MLPWNSALFAKLLLWYTALSAKCFPGNLLYAQTCFLGTGFIRKMLLSGTLIYSQNLLLWNNALLVMFLFGPSFIQSLLCWITALLFLAYRFLLLEHRFWSPRLFWNTASVGTPLSFGHPVYVGTLRLSEHRFESLEPLYFGTPGPSD